MKKYTAILMSAALVASSCTTGAGAGAYAGGSLGSILGSAIGGIAGGPRGSDIGTLVGMAGGAIVGGALGDAAEKQQYAQQHDELAQRNQRIQRSKAARRGNDPAYTQQGNAYYTQPEAQSYATPNTDIDPSQMVDNTNSADDRIDFAPADNTNTGYHLAPTQGTDGTTHGLATTNATTPSMDASRVEQLYSPAKPADGRLSIRNVRFADANGDGTLTAGEIGRVTFEIYNETGTPVYNFYPTVADATQNKRIYISPSVRVENINPGQGLRYTATVKADRRIKDGETQLYVSVNKDGKPISYVTVLKVPIRKQ